MTRRVDAGFALVFVTLASIAGCSRDLAEADDSALGGDRLPVRVETEVYAETDTELSGTAELRGNGCWVLDIGDGERLVVFPEGFIKDQTGLMMTSSDQSQQIEDGSQLTFIGGPAKIDAMPGGLGGFWGNLLTFCGPESGEFVVIDLILGVSD